MSVPYRVFRAGDNLFRVVGALDDSNRVVERLEEGQWVRVSSSPQAGVALDRQHGVEEVGPQCWESAGVFLRSWDREDDTPLEAWDPRARTWRLILADGGSLAADSESRSVTLAELAVRELRP